MTLAGYFRQKIRMILGLLIIQLLQNSAAQDLPQKYFYLPGPENSNSAVKFTPSGGICGWTVPLRGDISFQALNECESELLDLVLTVNEVDLTGHLHWRRLSGAKDDPLRFEGVDSESGFRVLRSYAWTSDSSTLRHLWHVDFSGVTGVTDLRASIRVADNFARHIPNDRSLGDFFYGYTRVFSRSSESNELPYRVVDQTQSDWVSIVTRHTALALQLVNAGPGAKYSIKPGPPYHIELAYAFQAGRENPAQALDFEFDLTMLALTSAVVADRALGPLLYSDTWGPFRYLANGIDRAFDELGKRLGSVGVAVVVFAILIRILFFPLTAWSMRQQSMFAAAEQAMRPKVTEINETLKGAEKSERLLELYKEHGVSPFTGLKGSVALFVQIPILIAVFNVTSESAIFRDASFLWLSDLSLPDQFAQLPFTIPILGGSLNLLPIALGAVNLLVGSIESRHGSTPSSTNRTAIIITILILIFFYSCSAALVLYWLTVNIAQIVERLYVRRKLD